MAQYVLDTDTVTLLRANHPEVGQRFASVIPPDQVVTTVITLDEVLTGWYTFARRANRPAMIERGYRELAEAVLFLAGLPILLFTVTAIAEYDRLKGLKLNVGRNDLRIAAIAMENGAVVVTRNVRDFGRVPQLVVEDWSTSPGPAATGS